MVFHHINVQPIKFNFCLPLNLDHYPNDHTTSALLPQCVWPFRFPFMLASWINDSFEQVKSGIYQYFKTPSWLESSGIAIDSIINEDAFYKCCIISVIGNCLSLLIGKLIIKDFPWIVEDVLVQVDNFYYLLHSMVLDMGPLPRSTNHALIILGRPSLATTSGHINCWNGVLQGFNVQHLRKLRPFLAIANAHINCFYCLIMSKYPKIFYILLT